MAMMLKFQSQNVTDFSRFEMNWKRTSMEDFCRAMSDREWPNLTDNHADRYHKVIWVNDTQFKANKKCNTGKTEKEKKDAEIRFLMWDHIQKPISYGIRTSLCHCLGLW